MKIIWIHKVDFLLLLYRCYSNFIPQLHRAFYLDRIFKNHACWNQAGIYFEYTGIYFEKPTQHLQGPSLMTKLTFSCPEAPAQYRITQFWKKIHHWFIFSKKEHLIIHTAPPNIMTCGSIVIVLGSEQFYPKLRVLMVELNVFNEKKSY